MSDGASGVSFQPGAGQLSGNASSQEQGTGTPKYITQEEFAQTFEKLQTELERRVQSMTDKAGSRIENRVQEKLAEIDRNAKLFGVDAETVEAAKQKAIMAELSRIPETPAATPAQVKTPDASPDPQTAYANAGALRLMKKYGVSLTQAEADSLPNTDPDTWLDAMEEKLAEKRAQGNVPSAAQMPSIGGGVSSMTSEAALLAELNQIMAHPKPEDMARMKEIRAKLNNLRK